MHVISERGDVNRAYFTLMRVNRLRQVLGQCSEEHRCTDVQRDDAVEVFKLGHWRVQIGVRDRVRPKPSKKTISLPYVVFAERSYQCILINHSGFF